MAFDKELYKDVIQTTNDEIVTNGDEEDSKGNNFTDGGVWVEADARLKDFLETNTDIGDTDKANAYSQFLISVVQTSLQQTLVNAKDIALEQAYKDAQINNLVKETELKEKLNNAQIADLESQGKVREAQSAKDLELKTQQIASMQNEDKNRDARTAGQLAEIKFKIEKLYPLQVRELEAEIKFKEADAKIKEKQLEVALVELEFKKQQLEMAKQDLLIKQQELKLKEQEYTIREAELRLKEAQLQIERTRIKLMTAQVKAEEKKIEIMEDELALKEKAFEFEKEKYEKTKELTDAEIAQKKADAKLREEQALGVALGIGMNHTIELLKSDTQKEVAYIYSTGSLK